MPPKKKSTQRLWRRMDLHLHTPASADFKQPEISYLDFLKQAEEKNLDIIAFADHNTVSGYASFLDEVESLEMLEQRNQLRGEEPKRLAEYRRLRDKILILPGFEFTATLGFHILGIFPPDATVRQLEHLLLSLRVPGDKLDEGSGQVGATVDVLTAYRLINEAGGIVIAAHANSSHGVAMVGSDFGGQTRIAYTQDPNLHALELTDLDSRSRRRMQTFFNGSKSDYPRKMHCIQGSDAHRLNFDPKFKNEMGLGDRVTEIFLDEASFDAIKQVFLGSDFARTRPARGTIVTEDLTDPLRPMREQGNTLVQAFHERFKDRRGIDNSILEDIAAMANTNGGTVYVGVSATAKAAVAGVDRVESSISELRAAIAKLITPAFDIHIETVKSQGKSVLRVLVPRGTATPYTFDGSRILVREGNKSRAATRDEIMQLVRESLAVESAVMAQPTIESRHLEEGVVEIVPPVEPPRNGVEITATEIRKNVQYHSVRDLRNRRIVHNVTRSSARHLWQYAIDEFEKNPVSEERVQWHGDLGIWKTYTHAGKARHDFVQRASGRLFIYYGVTEDGLHGPWREMVGAPSEPSAMIPAPPAAMMPIEKPPTQTEPAPAPETVSARIEQLEETRLPHPEPEIEPEPAPAPEREQEQEPEPSPEPEAQVTEPLAPIEEPSAASEPSTPKTRAQEWREVLDRAIEEARAAQQAAKKKENDNPPS